MKKLVTLAAIATLATLTACSTNEPAPSPTPSENSTSPDCGPKCQERIENHK